MSWETVIPICVSAVACLIAYLGYKRNATKDSVADAAERAKMDTNIMYIRNSVDEIKLDNRAMRKDLDGFNTRLTIAEQSIKSAHKRLDQLKDA